MFDELPGSEAASLLLRGFILEQAKLWQAKKPHFISDDVKQFIKLSDEIASNANRQNRIVDAIAFYFVPFALGLAAVVAVGLLVWMLLPIIVAPFTYNADVNRCLRNHNALLRSIIHALSKHEIDVNDDRLVNVITPPNLKLGSECTSNKSNE